MALTRPRLVSTPHTIKAYPIPPLHLEGFIRAEPAPALDALKTAFDEAGAWITNAQAYSNVAISLAFELPASRVGRLAGALARAAVGLYEGSEQTLAAWPVHQDDEPDKETPGTLMVTLVHDRPDEPGVVPSVPG